MTAETTNDTDAGPHLMVKNFSFLVRKESSISFSLLHREGLNGMELMFFTAAPVVSCFRLVTNQNNADNTLVV